MVFTLCLIRVRSPTAAPSSLAWLQCRVARQARVFSGLLSLGPAQKLFCAVLGTDVLSIRELRSLRSGKCWSAALPVLLFLLFCIFVNSSPKHPYTVQRRARACVRTCRILTSCHVHPLQTAPTWGRLARLWKFKGVDAEKSVFWTHEQTGKSLDGRDAFRVFNYFLQHIGHSQCKIC